MILFIGEKLGSWKSNSLARAPSVRKQLSQDLTCMDAHFDRNTQHGAGDADGRCVQLVALELTLSLTTWAGVRQPQPGVSLEG